MIKPKFSVTRCPNNPQRWNVYFNNSTPFDSQSIRKKLEKKQFQVLATTPNILVVRSKEARLTWHIEGLIQVDIYNHSSYDVKDIEHLIKDIFDVDSVKFSGESLG
ncbi:MAG: hypothetical protein JSW11_22530 [Candidatus Heimdallarchaeota archaeon]|nr:MAG: hypothetical protein JSW11_22530 [Candidatus Heimdallarchaeota archaeon]